MDVKCESCQTVYSLDDTRISDSGTSVRCTKCGIVFKVFRTADQKEENDQWLVKHIDGTLVSFDRLAVLQQWISEGKIAQDDLISKKGGEAKRIGDLPEMQLFFKNAQPKTVDRAGQHDTKPTDSARQTSEALSKTLPHTSILQQRSGRRFSNIPMAKTVQAPLQDTSPRGSRLPGKNYSTPELSLALQAETAAPPKPIVPFTAVVPVDGSKREDPDLSQVPASGDPDHWARGDSIEVAGPAWAEKSGNLPRYDDEVDQLPPGKRKIGRWIALFTSIIVIGGGLYLFLFRHSMAEQLWEKLLNSSKNDRSAVFFDRGRENFMLDSDVSYGQADREFQKVLALEENHGPTLAALAEMYAVWAQYLRDAELDAKTASEQDSGDAESLKKELERMNQLFREKLAEAARWANQANSVAPGLKEVSRAMADIARLQGDLARAKTHLAKASRQSFDPETEYVAVLIDMDGKKPPEELDRRLARVVGETPLLRAMYRQARVLASVGKNAEATAVLDRLFEMNSNHLRGRDLAARIEEGRPVALTLDKKTEPDETEAARKPDAGAAAATGETAAEQKVPEEAPGKTPSQQGAKAGIAAGVDNVESLLIQATKAQVNGKTSEAMSLFNRVLERSPNNIDALSGLGYCYLDKGNFGQAIATFRRAIGINPSFGPALLGLAETSKNSGQKDQALKYYKKYLEANPNGRQAGLAKRNIDELENEVSPSREAETPPSGEQEKSLPDNPPAADTGQETTVVITPPGDEKPLEKE